MVTIGTQLGPYKLLALLGAGGMGEVYRALDLRLEREVAIKVLLDKFTQDADLLTRFEREAKAVAALAHPNIVVLHDFGIDSGIPAVRRHHDVTLVMIVVGIVLAAVAHAVLYRVFVMGAGRIGHRGRIGHEPATGSLPHPGRQGPPKAE